MCDDHTEAENAAHVADLSRRGFTVMATGALAACVAGKSADGRTLPVTESEVVIPTSAGAADAYFVRPVSGRHAAVLMWPDIMGLRPAFRQMGKRLAESGYAVLVVNPFYRSVQGAVIQPGESFATPAVRDRLLPLARALNADTAAIDARAFLGFLDAQSSVDASRKAGVMGYCMSGPLAMFSAAALPERIGGVATFHGGGLVADGPTSPHLRIPQMKARFLIAIAQNDDARDPAAKETLRQAFAASGQTAEIEVYPAQHGWCPPDSPVYAAAQAERAWARMLVLFGAALA